MSKINQLNLSIYKKSRYIRQLIQEYPKMSGYMIGYVNGITSGISMTLIYKNIDYSQPDVYFDYKDYILYNPYMTFD
jgi:hypothetical protein